MGIMSFLRNRAGIILVSAIGLAIVAFLINDVGRSARPFWAESQTEVGEVAGEKIGIEEFKAKVDQNEANFRQQMGGNLNPQMSSYIVENTWNQTISEILIEKEVKRLGIDVGKNELNDMVSGKNPHPQVAQTFGNPQTGQIDRNQLNNFLNNLSSQPKDAPIRKQWSDFLAGIKRDRLSQKYLNLVKNSIYVTSLEAREDYSQRNKLANFSYVNLDYASIPDNTVKITDGDYEDYYNENKNRFKNKEESRSFDYVVFDARPSKADSLAIRNAVARLASEFKTTTNDSLFVSVNADSKTPVTYMKKGQLDPALDSLVFKVPAGTVVGPVYSGNAFKIAKVLDVRMMADSVKSRHILFNPTVEGGVDKARAKADSVLNLIRKGASFVEMAAKFGTDGTKDKGGDIGYVNYNVQNFDRTFRDAIFNGKTGDYKIITSQFGVHIINITDQKAFSQMAKVAVVDKTVASSNETLQASYAKASSFLSSADDAKSFDEQAKKSNLKKETAENVTGSQSMVGGLQNPRELIRWAFDAEKGDVSDKVFELENQYVVAKLTQVRPKGILPLEDVKKEIEPMVRIRVKAKMLREKLEKAASGASSINQVAQKVGKAVQPAQNIVFANPIIPGLAQENKVVGTVFGLKPGKLSKPIEGEQGVFMVVVSGFSNPAPLTNTINQKDQIAQGLQQRAQGQVLEVLKDKANIKDNRVRFF